MALPATFANSFWPVGNNPSGPTSYNIDQLWAKIDAGVVENQELLKFISSRASCSNSTARKLYDTAELKFNKNGFGKDDGASLLRTFEGLKYETAQVAKAHETVAQNLEGMIISPFTAWSNAHEGRVADVKDQFKEALADWDGLFEEVRKLKEIRNLKCSLADEAEEDQRFAPTSPNLTSAGLPPRNRSSSAASASSNTLSNASISAQQAAQHAAQTASQAAQNASTAATNLARQLSQRIKVTPTAHAVNVRFDRMRLEAKERELAASGRDTTAIQEKAELLDDENSDAANGTARNQDSSKSLPRIIDQLEIGGLVKHPRDWSIIFAKAKVEVPTTAVKVPLLGTTPDAHSGEDLVLWFRDNLDELGGSLSRSHELCRQLSEELAILRLVGEIGSRFYDSSDAFYAWRPDAFQLEKVQDQINEATASTIASPLGAAFEEKQPLDRLTEFPLSTREKRASSNATNSPRIQAQSPPAVPDKEPLEVSSPTLTQFTTLARSNTLSSYLSSAYEKATSNVTSLNSRLIKGGQENRLERLRKEAEEAEAHYRLGVRELDGLRLQVEELLSSSLSRLQKLEYDRLKAIKSVLSTYSATLASLNTPLQISSERTALLQEAFLPLSDLNSVIERYRTGPFRPKANVWVDYHHEETDVRYGIDLRHWRDTHSKEEEVPDILESLLFALDQAYGGLPNDDEKRKTWIYEVPLQHTHRLRNMVNNASHPIKTEDLQQLDPPVIASGLKLWLLEAATPLIPSSLYMDVKALYPTVGADLSEGSGRAAKIRALLERVPKIQLVVLDTILKHLVALIDSTPNATQPDSDYVAKLGATLGPCVVRPAIDTSKTINDKFPAKFFVDVLAHYKEILPAVMDIKKKVEEERYAPKRQRTKMVDQRLRRADMMKLEDESPQIHQQILKEDFGRRTGQRISEEPTELQPARVDEETKNNVEASPEMSQPKASMDQNQVPGFKTLSESDSALESEERKIIESPLNTQQAEANSKENISEVAPNVSAEDTEDDLDKPLATSTSLQRNTSGPGSSAGRRLNRISIGSANAKSRGPRPMSMVGNTVTSPTGSPLPAGPAGVRARAALFEQGRQVDANTPSSTPSNK